MEASKLDSCTPGQRLVVETFDKPLMVAAGAGSGKTFTLTQRTTNAFCPASGEAPLVQSLDEVLVITFTKKAAAELRDRIRRNLDKEGFTDVASRVDTAWVSTIHGMASRILRENALELGIDPAFEVIAEDVAEELHDQALNEIIKSITPDEPLLYELLSTDSLASSSGTSFGKNSARSQAACILNRVEALPANFDGLILEKPTRSPYEFLTALYEEAQTYYALFDEWVAPRFGKTGKPLKVKEFTATEEKAKADFECAFILVQEWLDNHAGVSFTDVSFDVDEYFEVFFAFPKLSATFGKARDALAFTEDYRSVYAELAVEAMASAGYKRLSAVVELAKRVNQRFKELKGVSRMDNTDLLRCTYEALKNHEAIANLYRSQFKLIMVDEFQDTDKLQVALIKLIAQPDLSNVCTVGDAQQSIYRFRGADVEVFKDYRNELPVCNSQAQLVELGDNFRSHGDVLAIVDAIFRQQNAFGGEFLHLEPKGKVNSVVNPIFGEYSEGALPRISFDIIQCKRKYKETGLSPRQAEVLGAYRIAEHFVGLLEQDVDPGSMALLLGTMSQADLYAQALREAGIESVIAGGSVFCTSDEAILVNNLLHVAVNRQDETALFSVLISPLFSLSDDVLLVLSRGSGSCTPSLTKGFFAHDEWQSADETYDGSDNDSGNEESEGVCGARPSSAKIIQQLSDSDARLWEWARDLMWDFVTEARNGSATEALRKLFVQSGLFYRLESQGAEGIASAGNLAKALHLVKGFEEDSSGIASLAFAFERHLQTAKEAPGALVTENARCLKIMTVHASKGLEFDHVALAALKTGDVMRAGLIVENVGDATYASLNPSISPTNDYISELRKLYDTCQAEDIFAGVTPGQTPGLRHEVLVNLQKQHELEEAQRLLYVALTRAVESLHVECVNEGSPTSKTFAYKGIMEILASALRWDDQVQSSRQLVDYGGSAPALVNFTLLNDAEELSLALESYLTPPCEEVARFEVPVWKDVSMPVLCPSGSSRADVKSYTSLSEAHSSDGSRDGTQGLSCDQVLGVDATSFGSAFHELAQRALLQARASGMGSMPMVASGEIEQKLARFGLEGQYERLDRALRRWFASDLAQSLITCSEVDAEVPFMVRFVNEEGQTRYLEGSLDALGVLDTGEALLVDYKTGGFAEETEEALWEKHALQAKCYSYALLDAGYSAVHANFVRMEHCAGESEQPQVVHYRFTKDDKASLHKEICGLLFA